MNIYSSVIYLLIMLVSMYGITRALYYFEYRARKKQKREERRRNARFYETIDYTNFNPKTGRYER